MENKIHIILYRHTNELSTVENAFTKSTLYVFLI